MRSERGDLLDAPSAAHGPQAARRGRPAERPARARVPLPRALAAPPRERRRGAAPRAREPRRRRRLWPARAPLPLPRQPRRDLHGARAPNRRAASTLPLSLSLFGFIAHKLHIHDTHTTFAFERV